MATYKVLLAALAGAVTVSGHGHVDNIVINGAFYEGFDVSNVPYLPNPPIVVAWANDALDNGFVPPSSYGSPDIICHKNAKNAKGHAAIAAGDSLFVQWNNWPISHHGPVMDYLAPCGDRGCETVDKTKLKFFKISEKGLIDGSTAPGFYASDELRKNNKGWIVQIPKDIKAGFYVLRHEIIGLHNGDKEDGAQNYPQCFNLEIIGSGTSEPEGILATELYKPDDAGVFFDIYRTVTSYSIPGPTLIPGVTAPKQSTSIDVVTADPTTSTVRATAAPPPAGGVPMDSQSRLSSFLFLFVLSTLFIGAVWMFRAQMKARRGAGLVRWVKSQN